MEARLYHTLSRNFLSGKIQVNEVINRFFQGTCLSPARIRALAIPHIVKIRFLNNPNTINVYNSLGVLHRKKGDYKKALHNYKKALNIHPDRERIHYNIGRLYIELKDPETAKTYFQQALQLNPRWHPKSG